MKENNWPERHRAKLVVVSDMVSDREYILDGTSVYLGRAAANDIVLSDQTVSNQHVQISWQDKNYVVSDLNSDSGTLVNGKKISKRVLADGDILTVGTTTFRFICAEERPPTENHSRKP